MNIAKRSVSFVRWISIAAVFGGILMPLSSMAWPFSRKKPKEERTYIHRKLNQQEANRFLSLVRTRGNIQQELSVFSRVFDEKRQEIKGYDARLAKVYYLDPDARYQFDATSNALFRLTSEVKNGSTNTIRNFVRSLKDDAAKRFMENSIGKSLANQQVQALVLLQREKKREQMLINEALLEEFGINPNANYRYDSDKAQILQVGLGNSVSSRKGQIQKR